MKPLAHQPAKKKASSNPVISQKLSYEKSEKELNAVVKKDVNSFFKKVRKQREARENPEKPYFYLPPDLLRKKVDQKKRESRKTLPKSDYDRSLTKSFEAAQKKTRAGKGVAQLRQQSQQSVPLLSFVMNMVQTQTYWTSILRTWFGFTRILVWTLPKCSLKDHLLRKWIFGKNLNIKRATLRPQVNWVRKCTC